MIEELRAKWTARLDEWRRLGVQVNGEQVASEILVDLKEITAGWNDDVLSIAQAARESGHSAEHLRRLVRKGKLQNLGRTHAPRVRRSDVPRKPRALSRSGPQLYDPAIDARMLLGRQGDR